MDRFTRFKVLRALWARARTLMAWLGVPHEREARHRAFRWQQIQIAERQVRDGIVRGTGDPDAYVRPRASGQQDDGAPAWYAHWDAQRQWLESQHRFEEQLRQMRHGQQRRR